MKVTTSIHNNAYYVGYTRTANSFGEYIRDSARYDLLSDAEAHINMYWILVDPKGIEQGHYYIDGPEDGANA